MNSYNNIIKSQDIKLINLQDKVQQKFITIDLQTPKSNVSKNTSDIESKILQTKKEAQKAIKIAQKEAYDKGLLEGLEKGVEKGIEQEREKVSLALQSITKIIKDFDALKLEYFKNSEKDIIDLILLIAKEVIHKEVSLNRDIILAVLRDAMKHMHNKEIIKILVNPRDYNYILETNPKFLSNFCNMKNTIIEEDEEIEQGGALIETHSGGVDARLDHQLNKIKERLSNFFVTSQTGGCSMAQPSRGQD